MRRANQRVDKLPDRGESPGGWMLQLCGVASFRQPSPDLLFLALFSPKLASRVHLLFPLDDRAGRSSYSASVPELAHFPGANQSWLSMDLILLRILFVLLLAAVCYFLHPFGIQSGWLGAVAGALTAGAVIVFELRVRALTLRRLIGRRCGQCAGHLRRGAVLPGAALGAASRLNIGGAANLRAAAHDLRGPAGGGQ